MKDSEAAPQSTQKERVGSASLGQHRFAPLRGEGRARLQNLLLFLILVLAASAVFRYRSTIGGYLVMDGSNFVYPYFSGAAHLDGSLQWKYAPDGLREFQRLPTASERYAYDFSPRPGETVRDYRYNNIGYMLVIWFAQHLFPFLPAISAVIALQCLVHIGGTWLVATSIEAPLYRALFVAGYGLNPLVLRFVATPFYYYLQVVPSAVLLAFMLRNVNSRGALVGYAVLLLSFVLRPSTLPLILLIVAVALVRSSGRMRVAHAVMAMALVAGVFAFRQPTVPWHTAYVGLGAYENPYKIEMDDDYGYGMYQKLRGTAISTDLPNGSFYDPAIRSAYYDFAKEQYLEIVTHDYPLVMRNTFLNLLQSFSIGYLVGRPALRIASLAAGVAVIAALLYSKQFLLVLALGAASAGTAVFFPPIPAYMNGNYLLLAFGLVKAAQYHLTRR